MALDAFTNFVLFSVAGSYVAADTVINAPLSANAILPAAPFYLVWWDGATYTTPTEDPNREIVRVTNKTTGGGFTVLTVTRAQDGTTAGNKAANSKMALALVRANLLQFGPNTGPYHRFKSDGTFQLLNTTTSLYHSLYLTGTAGNEIIEISAGEA
jgi:hypothetical protein